VFTGRAAEARGVKRSRNAALPLIVDADTSARMGRIRQRDTAAELLLRRWMWRVGYRYVLHNKTLPGRPDLSNARRKWAIFVHGCFWHGHSGCARASLPKRNADFWREKIRGNIARDQRKEGALRDMGFDVYSVWECQLGELARATCPADLSFPLPSLRRDRSQAH
jgi:DNA mismatch endonuclease, patch repair protein